MELNEQQYEAVTYSKGASNVLVTAGAGCGKTRTIIARAIHLVRSGTPASRILMMTFTNRAAREMKARLRSELGPVSSQIEAGTFHAFCLKTMSRIPNSFGISGLNIIDSDDQNSLMTLVRGRHISKKTKDLNKEFPVPGELVKYLSYSRNTCQTPDRYLHSQTDLNEHFIEICSKIFNEYDDAKRKRGYLDYDDLLEHFASTLGRKPDLRKAVTHLFDEVLVDEMQDTNPLQFAILRHFASEGVRLFCVGDPAQSIYRFRGAEFRHVYRFDELFGNSVEIPLSLNYRSYQEILDLSNWLLERSPLKYRNRLTADRGNCRFLPSVCDFDSPHDEAGWIADTILSRKEKGIPFGDVMVLIRSSYDAKPIEAAFIQRGIPYYFIGGTSLMKSAHVRDVLSLLRIVRNDQDDLAWMRFLRLWPRIGEKTAERLINSFYESDLEKKRAIEVLADNMGQAHNAVLSYRDTFSNKEKTSNCVKSSVDALTPILKERYDKWNSRSKDLQLLIKVAERYIDIGDFIDAFTLEPMTTTEIEKLENEDAVLLITVHSAKGTEAPICFVANAKQGTYPHSRSYGNIDSEEEERRILYVAITRAKNELFITRSTEYRSGFYVQNRPAVGEDYFLANLPEKLVTREFHGWGAESSSGLASLRDIY